MELVWSQRADRVLAVGEWLGASGIRNWALTRQEALTALDALERDGIGILGIAIAVLENRISSFSSVA